MIYNALSDVDLTASTVSGVVQYLEQILFTVVQKHYLHFLFSSLHDSYLEMYRLWKDCVWNWRPSHIEMQYAPV